MAGEIALEIVLALYMEEDLSWKPQHSSNKLARSCKPTVHKTGGQNKQTPGSSLTS